MDVGSFIPTHALYHPSEQSSLGTPMLRMNGAPEPEMASPPGGAGRRGWRDIETRRRNDASIWDTVQVHGFFASTMYGR